MLAVVAVMACSEDKEAACTVDADCVQGSFCRAGICAAVASANDGGADSAPPAACSAPGASCALDVDCCSPPCVSFRCGGGSSGTSGTSGTSGGSSGTTSSGGNCQTLYGLCSFDGECCTGLRCNGGTCR